MFATLPIEHVRPFLGPVFAWVSKSPDGAYVKLPKMITLIFKFLSLVVRDEQLRMTDARVLVDGAEPELFRADARVDGTEVQIGGWMSGVSPDKAP